MPTVLITGSNRGLGLEWARQCAARGWRVNATCRHPGSVPDLQGLASGYQDLRVHRLDVTAADQIEALAMGLQGEPLDLLVNNAGVHHEHWGQDPIGQIDYAAWEETFRVNTLGPMRITEALLPNLLKGSRPLVLAVSSDMGSIGRISTPPGLRLPLEHGGAQRRHARTGLGARALGHRGPAVAPGLGANADGRGLGPDRTADERSRDARPG